MVKSMKILLIMDRRLARHARARRTPKARAKTRSVRIDFRTKCFGSTRRLRIAFSPLVKYHAGGVSKVILAAFIVICILALYFYAHYNWHPLPVGTTIDRILVEKSAKRLSIFRDGNQVKRYRIALGRNPVGAKQEEGDMKTPEGIYEIDNRNAQSSFHLALHISYPSDEDNGRAAARGVSAGSDIMIHGIQNGRGWIGAFHRWKNWTAGCIALTDEEIEELWRVTPNGTTIEIRP
jgi:lipoprotein-anchoring transpeptidase ErfK/SrfK